MNKDLEFLLAIIIFLLVAKNICGKTRVSEGFGCNVNQCPMDICNAVMENDSSATTGEIVGIATNPKNKYHKMLLNLTGTLSNCNTCGDADEEEMLLDLSNNFKDEQGVCERKQEPASSLSGGSGGFKRSTSSGGFGGRASAPRAGCRSKDGQYDRECQACISVIKNDPRTLSNPLCKNNCIDCR